MASLNKIILFPISPVFNKDAVRNFENFSKEDSLHLYSTLLLNNVENLSKLNGNFEITYCFDEKDKELLPDKFINNGITPLYVNTGRVWDSISKLISKQIVKENTCVLIIFSHSIGLSQNKIIKLFNLLNMMTITFS
jgi:hypothetical protein